LRQARERVCDDVQEGRAVVVIVLAVMVVLVPVQQEDAHEVHQQPQHRHWE
jgi:hypothetical protein